MRKLLKRIFGSKANETIARLDWKHTYVTVNNQVILIDSIFDYHESALITIDFLEDRLRFTCFANFIAQRMDDRIVVDVIDCENGILYDENLREVLNWKLSRADQKLIEKRIKTSIKARKYE